MQESGCLPSHQLGRRISLEASGLGPYNQVPVTNMLGYPMQNHPVISAYPYQPRFYGHFSPESLVNVATDPRTPGPSQHPSYVPQIMYPHSMHPAHNPPFPPPY
jgi:hypothetical protein